VKLKLIIDLQQTTKINSAGLAVILQCHKNLTNIGNLKLANANEKISSLLEVTHADQILDCHTSIEAAKQYF
jgi:anti-anti-sigma factor